AKPLERALAEAARAGTRTTELRPRRGPVAISAGGALSPRTETGLESPPHFKASPISALDSADLSCSPFGLLSQGRSQPGALSARGALSLVALDSEGSSLTHALRSDILRAILSLAAAQKVPVPPVWNLLLAQGGLHFLRSPLYSLSPGVPALRPLPLDDPPSGPQPDTGRRSPCDPNLASASTIPCASAFHPSAAVPERWSAVDPYRAGARSRPLRSLGRSDGR
ncbi:MAG: hypothetical protein ACI8RZ_006005, partial [Myxococcota bacterium]